MPALRVVGSLAARPSVFESGDGLLENLREGLTWIETSTINVGQLRAFSARLAGTGVSVQCVPDAKKGFG